MSANRALVFILFGILGGCASSRMSDTATDDLFRRGEFESAAQRLQEGLKNEGEGKDQLLFLLDLGLSYHAAGQYAESNKYFLEADKIAEIKDYTSLATEASTLLVSDNVLQYKGEDFEKVMINVYLSINYALMGKFEDALVEARRVNRKLYLMIHDGQRKYKLNSFAYYFSAILYEASKEYADSYIDYKKTYELSPSLKSIGKELWRNAGWVKIREDQERWEKEFSLGPQDLVEAKKIGPKSEMGEIIILYENGISPIKKPHPSWQSVPKFFPRLNPVSSARVKVNDQVLAETQVLYDIESTAIENLDEKYAGIIAKKVAGVVAKEIAGNQVENVTNSEALGFLTKIILHVSDQADVRSWSLLPKDLQVARIPVEPGEYRVGLDIGEAARVFPGPVQITVGPGEKKFINFRYIP